MLCLVTVWTALQTLAQALRSFALRNAEEEQSKSKEDCHVALMCIGRYCVSAPRSQEIGGAIGSVLKAQDV